MTTNISFDLMWETAEQLYKDEPSNIQAITTEVIAKLMVYKSIDTNNDLESEEKNKAKQYIMGKILLALSHLTVSDDLNIYPILKSAIASFRLDKMGSAISK